MPAAGQPAGARAAAELLQSAHCSEWLLPSTQGQALGENPVKAVNLLKSLSHKGLNPKSVLAITPLPPGAQAPRPSTSPESACLIHPEGESGELRGGSSNT